MHVELKEVFYFMLVEESYFKKMLLSPVQWLMFIFLGIISKKHLMFPRDAMLTVFNSQHRYAIISICTNYPPLSRHYAGGYVTCQKDKDLEAN